MKKMYLIVISLTLLTSMGFAQITSGGERTSQPLPTNQDKNKFGYLGIGLAIPTGDFADDSFTNHNAGFASSGLNIELGSVDYFGFELPAPNFSLGYNLGISFNMNGISMYNPHPSIYDNWETGSYYSLQTGIGPVVSYQWEKYNLTIDAFLRFSLHYVYADFYSFEAGGYDVEFYGYSEDGLDFRTAFGALVRYNKFFAGLTISPEEHTFSLTTSGNDNETDTTGDVDMSLFCLTVGFTF
jgi:hypothetical protein